MARALHLAERLMLFTHPKAIGLAVVAGLFLGVAAPAGAQRPPTAARRWPVSARQLREAEVTADRGKLDRGITGPRSLGVRLSDGRGRLRDAVGVFKSFRQWERGTFATHVHEVAAYELSRAAGLHLVPPTVVFEHGGKEGSLQWFLDRLAAADRNPGRIRDDELVVVHLFDYLVGNSDRNSQNYGRDGDGRIVAIDHSHTSFGPKLVPYSGFRGKLGLRSYELSAEHRELIANINLGLVARGLVRTGLEIDKVGGVLQRIRNLQLAYPPGDEVKKGEDGELPPEEVARLQTLATEAFTRHAERVARARGDAVPNGQAGGAGGKPNGPPPGAKSDAPPAAPKPAGRPGPNSRKVVWGLRAPPAARAPAAALPLFVGEKQAFVLDAEQYQQLRTGALQLLGEHPPVERHYLGVGRSSSAVHGFLEQLGIATTYLPADGLKKDLKEGTDRGALEQAFHRHFEALLPAEALRAKRIVLHQRSDTGATLPLVRELLESYLRAQGSNAQVETVAFSSAGPGNHKANVKVIDTQRLPGLDALGDSLAKYYAVHPFHRIGTDADVRAVEPSANFQQFARHLARHMGADGELAAFLKGAAK